MTMSGGWPSSARVSISRIRFVRGPLLEKREKWGTPVVKMPTSSHRARRDTSAYEDVSSTIHLRTIVFMIEQECETHAAIHGCEWR